MYLLIERLKFLVTATNQYGVHSPFIYHFLTNCLYQKPRSKTSKALNVLLKSMAYFNVQSVAIPEEEYQVKNAILAAFPEMAFHAGKSQLIYLDDITPGECLHYFGEKGNLKAPSMLFINKIHNSPARSKNWDTLIAQPGATVTLDLFYCGLVFMRKRQAKEHFKIRI